MSDPKDEQMTDSTTEIPADSTTEVPTDSTTEVPTDGMTEFTPGAPSAGMPEPAVRRGPSVPTVVWGLIFALIAAGVIASQTSDTDLNLDVTAPTALLVAGVVLVLWGIAGLGRSRLRR